MGVRQRATAVVLKDSKVLLVKDKGKHCYSLPGGGIKHHENSVKAATRELYEEVGLQVVSATRLRSCDFVTFKTKHRVCLIHQTIGTPKVKSKELQSLIWWDMKMSPPPVYKHVTAIMHTIISSLSVLGDK